jgi:hypothetical protein
MTLQPSSHPLAPHSHEGQQLTSTLNLLTGLFARVDFGSGPVPFEPGWPRARPSSMTRLALLVLSRAAGSFCISSSSSPTLNPFTLPPPEPSFLLAPTMRQFLREFADDFGRHPVVSRLSAFVPASLASWVRGSPTVALPVTLAILLLSFVIVRAELSQLSLSSSRLTTTFLCSDHLGRPPALSASSVPTQLGRELSVPSGC